MVLSKNSFFTTRVQTQNFRLGPHSIEFHLTVTVIPRTNPPNVSLGRWSITSQPKPFTVSFPLKDSVFSFGQSDWGHGYYKDVKVEGVLFLHTVPEIGEP